MAGFDLFRFFEQFGVLIVVSLGFRIGNGRLGVEFSLDEFLDRHPPRQLRLDHVLRDLHAAKPLTVFGFTGKLGLQFGHLLVDRGRVDRNPRFLALLVDQFEVNRVFEDFLLDFSQLGLVECAPLAGKSVVARESFHGRTPPG